MLSFLEETGNSKSLLLAQVHPPRNWLSVEPGLSGAKTHSFSTAPVHLNSTVML